MLRSIYDKVSIFGKEGIAPDDESMLKEFLIAFYRRWNDEVQPAVGEVQLLASPAVTDLADRTSWALMELHQIVDEGRARDSVRTGELLAEFSVKSYHLLDATRNAMRTELGLTTPIKAAFWRAGLWGF